MFLGCNHEASGSHQSTALAWSAQNWAECAKNKSADTRRELPEPEQVVVISNVRVSTTSVQNFREIDPSGPIVGWAFSAVATTSKTGGPVSVFPRLAALLCSRVFEVRALTHKEPNLLTTMTMREGRPQAFGYFHRHFHQRWLGIEWIPLAATLHET